MRQLGLAVSGGPDSLALLLLAAAARPGHGRGGDRRSRPARRQPRRVRDGRRFVRSGLGVPHDILTVEWDEQPESNLQAQARDERYALLARLGAGARARRHRHRAPCRRPGRNPADAARPRSGPRRACAARARRRPLGEGVWLIRPLLGWRRDELGAIVAEAGIEAGRRPRQRDPRHDRTRVRRLLARCRLARSRRGWRAAAHQLGRGRRRARLGARRARRQPHRAATAKR